MLGRIQIVSEISRSKAPPIASIHELRRCSGSLLLIKTISLSLETIFPPRIFQIGKLTAVISRRCVRSNRNMAIR